MGVASLQTANPSMGTVSRMPQTTAAVPATMGVPFPRLSRQGQIFGPQIAGQPFGQLWTPTLKPVGGYVRSLWLYLSASGGNWSAAAAAADAPWSAIQNIYFRDPFGQPIAQCDGYSLFLIQRYSGQTGTLGYGNDPALLPSYSAINTTTGAFTWGMQIPLELDSSGYGSLPMMNASSQPQIQIQFNISGQVYSSQTGSTAPTLSAQIDEPFWMAPVDNPQAAPADVGSSAQWSVSRAAQGIGTTQFQRIQLPRVGTYIHTLILVLRDANGVRIDAWPSTDLQLWVDGVPILQETLAERSDNMYKLFGLSRPTGVLCYSFRNSIQSFVSSGDTYDLMLPTTPATLLEVVGTWGTISAGPATLTCITGELFPLGGVPYSHLAQ